MGLRNAKEFEPPFPAWRQPLRRRTGSARRAPRRLGLEGLESRLVLASFYLGEIYPGDVMSRQIIDVGDEHIYTLDAASAQWLTVSLANTDSAAFLPQAGVYSDSGSLLRSVGSGAKAVVQLPAAGQYQLRVRDNNHDATGPYTVSLEGLQPATPYPGTEPMTLGGWKSGTTAVRGEIDQFTFNGQQGDVVTLSVGKTDSGSYRPRAGLYAPGGTLVDTVVSGTMAVATLPATGAYVIQVYDDDYTHTGEYLVALEGLTPPSADAVSVIRGDVKTGKIESGEVDAYTFSGSAGDRVAVSLSDFVPGTTTELWAALYAPDGKQVTAAGADEVENGKQVLYTLPAAGVYVIQVYDNDYRHAEDYALALEGLTQPSSDALTQAVGATFSGELSAGEVDAFTFTGLAGHVVQVVLSENTADRDYRPRLTLYSPAAELVAEFFADGSQTVVLPADGTYLILVADNDFTSAGQYQLQLTGYPEINVLWNSVVIQDGDSSPTPADGTDFRGAARGGPGPMRTYTVRNTGNVPLELGPVSVPAGFLVVDPPVATLDPGAEDNFTLQLATEDTGRRTGQVRLATNDSDENPFNYTITGLVNSVVQNAALPEDVDGNGAVEPLDVLLAINYLNTGSSGVSPIFADVTGDGFLTPQDVLRIINAVNRSFAAQVLPASEGESAEAASPLAAGLWDGLPIHPPASATAAAGGLGDAPAISPRTAPAAADTGDAFDDDLTAALDAIAADVQLGWTA